ncbi:hypothetical protein GCM10009535_04290 [Streptomyces thermocarboxydovorans]|uniref:Uncharacterized protein n=1 Tax=Streptomyces thermocarboxydovorans TaxID=59298 RepID=A0ABN1H7M8_9ACTN
MQGTLWSVSRRNRPPPARNRKFPLPYERPTGPHRVQARGSLARHTGSTALEWAREGGHTETVELLVTAVGAGAEAAPGSSADRAPGVSP